MFGFETMYVSDRLSGQVGHSEAMVVDGMTKWSSQVARDTTMSFAKQSTWRVVQDNKLTAAKKREHIGRLADIDENDNVDRTAIFVTSYIEEDDAEDFASYTYFVGLLATSMTPAFRTNVG